MFQRAIDDLKESTGNALRLTSLAGAAVVAAFMTMKLRIIKTYFKGGVPRSAPRWRATGENNA